MAMLRGVDVDTDDFGLRKIAPQGEGFLAGRAAKRHQAGNCIRRKPLAHKGENSGMAIRFGLAVGLKQVIGS